MNHFIIKTYNYTKVPTEKLARVTIAVGNRASCDLFNWQLVHFVGTCALFFTEFVTLLGKQNSSLIGYPRKRLIYELSKCFNLMYLPLGIFFCVPWEGFFLCSLPINSSSIAIKSLRILRKSPYQMTFRNPLKFFLGLLTQLPI